MVVVAAVVMLEVRVDDARRCDWLLMNSQRFRI